MLLALLWELARPRHVRCSRVCASAGASAGRAGTHAGYDPGRERRAEQRARELLRSCVNDEDWAMYRDLGFLRVGGGLAERAARPPTRPYAYLIYPHKPLVAYVPQTGELLNEYCVAFPDHTRPYGSSRLPDSDDVLAKWMALIADERRLIAEREHAPPRPPGRPRPRPPRPRAARALGARAWPHAPSVWAAGAPSAERGLRRYLHA